MSRWDKSHFEDQEKGKWGACREILIKCKCDNGAYGCVIDLIRQLQLTDEEQENFYKIKKRMLDELSIEKNRYRHWTLGAVQCYLRDCKCLNCFIAQNYSINCHMNEAVKVLIEKFGKPKITEDITCLID